MATIKVKGGTRQGCESLCRTCSYGHIIKGFCASQEEVFCRYFFFEREIRFRQQLRTNRSGKSK
jgi:hypothetical protein